MQNTSFSDASLVRPRFDGAIFQNSQIKNAELRDATFVDADMRGTEFVSARLTGHVNFRGAKLGGVTFKKSVLDNPDFTNANLIYVDFGDTILNNPIFRDTMIDKNNSYVKNISPGNMSNFIFCDDSAGSSQRCEKPRDLPINPPPSDKPCTYASAPVTEAK